MSIEWRVYCVLLNTNRTNSLGGIPSLQYLHAPSVFYTLFYTRVHEWLYQILINKIKAVYVCLKYCSDKEGRPLFFCIYLKRVFWFIYEGSRVADEGLQTLSELFLNLQERILLQMLQDECCRKTFFFFANNFLRALVFVDLFIFLFDEGYI